MKMAAANAGEQLQQLLLMMAHQVTVHRDHDGEVELPQGPARNPGYMEGVGADPQAATEGAGLFLRTDLSRGGIQRSACPR